MADKLQTLLVLIEASTEQMRREMKKAGASTQKFSRKADKSLTGIQKSFKNLGKAAVAFGAIYAVALVTKGIKNTLLLADNMGMLEDRIKSATRETGGFNAVWSDLLATSLKTGAILENSVSLFQRLAFTQKELGATNKDMTRLNDIIAKLGIISGATTEQLKNGTLQLSQGLGEGIFRAQEFNSVLENMPAVLNTISRSLGITVAEMRRLVKEGNLLSRTVFDAILTQGEEVDKQFSEIPPRITRAWAKAGTAITATISDINKELSITAGIAVFLEDFAELLAPEDLPGRLSQIVTKIKELNQEILDVTAFAGVGGIGGAAERNLHNEVRKLRKEAKQLGAEIALKTGEISIFRPEKEEEKPKPPFLLEPLAVPSTIKPLFDEDVDFLRILRAQRKVTQENADETLSILSDLQINVLRSSGKVAEAIRREADIEIAEFAKRIGIKKSSEKDLANFRILKNEEVAAKLKKIADEDLKRLNKAAVDFGNAMAAAFESRGIDAILNGDLSGALKGIIRDFAAMALRLAILKPLAESLFGGVGFFSGIGKAIFGKAGGGTVQPGIPIKVGERGSELFIPNTTGRIVNAADSRRMGGQQTSITQNITIATDVKNTVRAEIFQIFPILEQQILNSVNQQRIGVLA